MIRTFADPATEDLFNGVDSRRARQACPNTLWAVVARNGAALVFSIGLTVVVPKLNLKHRGTLKNDIV